MPTPVPDPRTLGWARPSRSNYLLIANSDIGYSRPVLEYYAGERGIPAANIVDLPLGTIRTHWDPVSNGRILTDFIQPVSQWMARIAQPYGGIILGPGVPPRILVRGETQGGNYFPTNHTFPPLTRVLSEIQRAEAQFTSFPVIAGLESGSGNYSWRGYYPTILRSDPLFPDAPLPNPLLETYSLGGTWEGDFPSEQGRRQLGGRQLVPVGRIGWFTWSATYDITESEALCKQVIDNATAGMAANSQPAPIMAMVRNSSNQGQFGRLVAKFREWGYDAEYFYGVTPDAENESFAPLAGAAFTGAQYTSGAIVNYPAMLLTGTTANENAITQEPFRSAWDASVIGNAPMGMSYGYSYGGRAIQQGGMWGCADVTHRTIFTLPGLWRFPVLLATGMPVMHALAMFGPASQDVACGDPLFAPFHWDPAPELPEWGYIEPIPTNSQAPHGTDTAPRRKARPRQYRKNPRR